MGYVEDVSSLILFYDPIFGNGVIISVIELPMIVLLILSVLVVEATLLIVNDAFARGIS
tara:strand:+ start:238 stop:414 length:177 start_codon:yes stop_codon:yes gene_type:complete